MKFTVIHYRPEPGPEDLLCRDFILWTGNQVELIHEPGPPDWKPTIRRRNTDLMGFLALVDYFNSEGLYYLG